MCFNVSLMLSDWSHLCIIIYSTLLQFYPKKAIQAIVIMVQNYIVIFKCHVKPSVDQKSFSDIDVDEI